MVSLLLTDFGLFLLDIELSSPTDKDEKPNVKVLRDVYVSSRK